MTTTAPPYELFTVADFALECGVVLPEARLAYHLSGSPDASPPLLTCTAFSQNYEDLAYLRGPGLALDPSRHWIIHTELLGNGRSSSPSNTPSLAGPDFPPVTIRDNVRLQRALLSHLGVERVAAVIGASMGGQQAIQWAVSYPEQVERAVIIVGSGRATWHARLFLDSLAGCIRSDPAFAEGRYLSPPLEGLSRMSATWAPWAFSPQFYATEQYQRYEDTRADNLAEFLTKWRSRYHQKDANDLLCQLAMWSGHDVSHTPGGDGTLATALGRVQAQVLYLPCRTDAYFAVPDVEAEAALVSQAQVRVIESINGHAAGFGRSPADRRQINTAVAWFLDDEKGL